MSKAATLAPVVATLAALALKRSNPATFHVDTKTPGLAGVLVMFRAPSVRPTPTLLKTAFDEAIARAHPRITVNADTAARLAEEKNAATDNATGLALSKQHRDVNAALSFLASLPEVVSPVAALGLAVRVARDDDHEWKHNGRSEGHSRWTYCDSRVTTDSVSIHGSATCAEAHPDGSLSIDADVPADIAARLRDAYTEARGVVEPSRIVALIGAFLRARGGRAITSDCYLLPEVTPTACGVLAGLVDLDGWAESIAVADPARIARLSSPVTKSIEEQIADVVKATEAFIAKAAAVAAPPAPGTDAPTLQKRTADTVRAELNAAREAAALWRDRLSLSSLDVEAQMSALDKAIDEADEKAQAAQDKRRADRKLAKEAGALLNTPEALAALDEADRVTEARAKHAEQAIDTGRVTGADIRNHTPAAVAVEGAIANAIAAKKAARKARKTGGAQ